MLRARRAGVRTSRSRSSPPASTLARSRRSAPRAARSRRLDKTDIVDAVAIARALLAEPTLGPVQALEVYDPFVAKIEAVLEHRRMLVDVRTLALHHVHDQIAKLPTRSVTNSARPARSSHACVASRSSTSRRVTTLAGLPVVVADRVRRPRPSARREIRQLERDLDQLLDEHGTTLRDEPGIGPIAAATFVVEVGDPHRFDRESKFARWCGTGAVALSSGEGAGEPVRHRLDFGGNRRINSVLYIASVTQQRDPDAARPTSNAKSAKARPAEKPAAPTNDTSPTASSDACGTTNNNANDPRFHLAT